MLWIVIPYYFIHFASQIVPAMAIGITLFVLFLVGLIEF